MANITHDDSDNNGWKVATIIGCALTGTAIGARTFNPVGVAVGALGGTIVGVIATTQVQKLDVDGSVGPSQFGAHFQFA